MEKDRARTRRYKEKNPQKYKAQCRVSNAIRDGLLIRPENCSSCGADGEIQGHHWSYEEVNWLDVEWLCIKCHAKVHEELRESGVEL